ncbi:MAG TPA: LPS export ABC transporter periplasmic protein LptC [Blastocatellia bacterium]|nr:LPS export ABC transporter periplasmic protein LptC [Blastocatellia bacterium]
MLPRKLQYKLQQKLPYVGRAVSLIVLMGIIGALVVSFIKRSGKIKPLPEIARVVSPGRNVVSVTEGYEFLSRENGKTKLKLIAAKDITYDDGRHEMEKLDLTTYSPDGKESERIRADHGAYQQQSGIVTFTGNVVANNASGLEVKSEALTYDQNNEVATSEVLVNFSYGEISGSSTGAMVRSKEKTIELKKDAKLTITRAPEAGKPGTRPPVEIRGQHASFAQLDGIAVFEGEASVTQGQQSGRADKITGVFTKPAPGQKPKLMRVEARGNAQLKSQEPGKSSELQARDMDFHFDDTQHLKLAGGWGGAKAVSLEKDSPREITAEKIEATYTPTANGSDISSAVTQGRTTIKIAPTEADSKAGKAAERVLEADGVQVSFHPGGKYMARAEANGNALLTVTPVVINQKAERQRLRAPKFTADFFDTKNLLKTFVAEGGAVAEFEPMQEQPKGSKRQKRTLAGRKLTAGFDEQLQDVTVANVEGEAKFTEGERNATAANAIYTASTNTVAMRGKPQVWDAALRVNADEIDANTETGESLARGRVRTTYYSRETTNGAAPFKKPKAPVFIASDRALVKHREGAARYEGNARAWQDDNFVRAAMIELDRNEKTMIAAGNVNSALYSVEREIEPATPGSAPPAGGAALQPAAGQTGKRREVVPIFAAADQMNYSDVTRVVKYNGDVKIKQGSDQIDAATAEAKIDEEHKLERMTATTNVVLTQPARRGTGDRVEYTPATDTAILTGNLARVEDREREAVTTSAKLTLHLRDARIQAADEGGSRRVKTTHRIRQQ